MRSREGTPVPAGSRTSLKRARCRHHRILNPTDWPARAAPARRTGPFYSWSDAPGAQAAASNQVELLSWRRSHHARPSTSSCTMVCWRRTVGGAPRRSPTPGTHLLPRPRRCSRMRHGSSARPGERAIVCRRAGGERRGVRRSRRDDRRRPRRGSVVYTAGESRPGHHRERGGAPAARGAQVVVARPDAAHVRGGRVGVRPVWRPHARGGHHRGPRRHWEDSHPSRAPHRRGSARPACASRASSRASQSS
jgi:hypothetical protein